jgi:isopentenyl diphosphate isomerase/L-lactate dehydrogenase-like FMN-dependent dehydrogenase
LRRYPPASARIVPLLTVALIRLNGVVLRGNAVVKTLALGARAFPIRRAYLWGLAATDRPASKRRRRATQRNRRDVAPLGHRRLHGFSSKDVIIPGDFTATLDASAQAPL